MDGGVGGGDGVVGGGWGVGGGDGVGGSGWGVGGGDGVVGGGWGCRRWWMGMWEVVMA